MFHGFHTNTAVISIDDKYKQDFLCTRWLE